MFAPTPFFRPTDAFIAWLSDQAGDKTAVIDAGCGYGNLVAALIDAGCGAIGIDLFAEKIEEAHTRYPQTCGRLVIGDTRTHTLAQIPGSIIVFARPCHDAFWISDTLSHTAKTARRWLYISKPGNAERDLEGLNRKRVLVGVDVGTEGEEVWEVKPLDGDSEDPVRWCLVKMKFGATNDLKTVWVRDGGNRWFWGWSGSYVPKCGEEVLEDAWVQDDLWLDHTKTAEWQMWDLRSKNRDLDNGWLSPDGKLYRCAYYEHNGLCYGYLKKEVKDLENEGWCKIQREPDTTRTLFVVGSIYGDREHRLTREQVRTLLDEGFKVPNYLLEEAEGDWSQIIAKQVDDEFDGLT